VLEYDFEESVTCWVCLTSRALERALNEELEPHGITFPQWQVLGWLAFEGELTQSQLAERMRIEAPTLAGILDRMERDEWISRETDPADRRKKVVRPADRVQPVWAKIVAAARRVRARATRGMSPEEVELLHGLLVRMRDNLNQDSPSPECK
jgi:MarR family transcriptional regulator for hemolysin